MIPTLPFDRPCIDLVMKAIGRLLENPNNMLEIMVQVKAIMIIGFRPNLSDARPHEMPTRAWESEKTSDSIPA